MTKRRRYFLEGVVVEYEGEQLLTLSLHIHSSPGKKHIPAIAKTASGTFHPFPVQEKELTEIFGPPDKTNDYFKW